MKKSSILAGFLSLIVPGSGQMYLGDGNRGAAILAAAIVIANLNFLILSLISIANPALPIPASDSRAVWTYCGYHV